MTKKILTSETNKPIVAVEQLHELVEYSVQVSCFSYYHQADLFAQALSNLYPERSIAVRSFERGGVDKLFVAGEEVLRSSGHWAFERAWKPIRRRRSA